MNEQAAQTWIPLRPAYEFGATHGLDVDDIRDMEFEANCPFPTTVVRRARIVELFEKHGFWEDFKKEHWPYGNTSGGEKKRLRYLQRLAEYNELVGGDGISPIDPDISILNDASEFPREADLRDFLAKGSNLERLEHGLHLYEADGRKGVEFHIDAGRIDLLAVDKDGKFAVIELKLSRGRERALGQLLYYMGWVDKHLGKGPCRGFIIANEINEELTVAIALVPSVKLAKYIMNFKIETVGQ